ncbi:MAG: hypothetical protein C0475_03715 [Planctomyces sp.]|nr:hypothetical protein [Planctomyces sp.]
MANTPSSPSTVAEPRTKACALLLAVLTAVVWGLAGPLARAHAGEDPLWDPLYKAAAPLRAAYEGRNPRLPPLAVERPAPVTLAEPIELVVELDVAPGAPALPFRLDIVRATQWGDWKAAEPTVGKLGETHRTLAGGTAPTPTAGAVIVAGELINGQERIQWLLGVAVHDTGDGAQDRTWLMMWIPVYDSMLFIERIAPAANGRDIGRVAWVTVRPGGEMAVVGGRARIAGSSGERFVPATAEPAGSIPPESFAGTWRVKLATDPDEAVGRFTVNKETGEAAGTFLTTTGDSRYLVGRVDGRTLRLSTFDGAHAFLYRATLGEDGQSLAGDFWSGTWHHEAWTARRDETATLADGFAHTKVIGTVADLDALKLVSPGGHPAVASEDAPPGTPRIIELFGSWCPNCHDAAVVLNEIDRDFRPRGLRVLGLALEHHTDPKAAQKSVRGFIARRGLNYPVLIAAGLSDKAKATAALGFLEQFKAFPTTIFIRRDGSVLAVHSGFSGPATGQEYTKLRARFFELAEELVRQ